MSVGDLFSRSRTELAGRNGKVREQSHIKTICVEKLLWEGWQVAGQRVNVLGRLCIKVINYSWLGCNLASEK